MLLTGRMFTFKILSPRGRRLEVKGARKNGASVWDSRGERERLHREAHENRFYSLSESAENSCWLRDSREDKCSREARKLSIDQRKSKECMANKAVKVSYYTTKWYNRSSDLRVQFNETMWLKSKRKVGGFKRYLQRNDLTSNTH